MDALLAALGWLVFSVLFGLLIGFWFLVKAYGLDHGDPDEPHES